MIVNWEDVALNFLRGVPADGREENTLP